jgi:hypothetical protein
MLVCSLARLLARSRPPQLTLSRALARFRRRPLTGGRFRRHAPGLRHALAARARARGGSWRRCRGGYGGRVLVVIIVLFVVLGRAPYAADAAAWHWALVSARPTRPATSRRAFLHPPAARRIRSSPPHPLHALRLLPPSLPLARSLALLLARAPGAPSSTRLHPPPSLRARKRARPRPRPRPRPAPQTRTRLQPHSRRRSGGRFCSLSQRNSPRR